MVSSSWRLSAGLSFGRPALPDDVAAVIAFLARDDASFVNGVILPVQAG
jgi:meso-butanediol dehydrogenase / (S,S)-butanediol dehydrogenase / diacetyl reductase